MIPYPSGGVSPLATQQLAAWEDIARDWLTFQTRDGEGLAWVERCVSCLGGLYRTTDDHGKPYKWTDDQRLAMIVSHLRLSHLDLDPNP